MYLTQDEIVDAGLRVLDRGGLEQFSMRRVADELGSAPGSLYWHVRNKDELLDLIFDRVASLISVERTRDPGAWADALKETGREWRRVLQEHRDLVRVAFGRMPTGPQQLKNMENLLFILCRAGFPPTLAAFAAEAFARYVHAFVLEESAGLRIGGETRTLKEAEGLLRDYYRMLPAQEFPTLVEFSDLLTAGDADERFEFGVDLLVNGLASVLATVLDGPVGSRNGNARTKASEASQPGSATPARKKRAPRNSTLELSDRVPSPRSKPQRPTDR